MRNWAYDGAASAAPFCKQPLLHFFLSGFSNKSLYQRHARAEKDNRKRKTRRNGHGLQCSQSTTQKQGDSQKPLESGPKYALRNGSIHLAARADRVDYKGTRIG